MVMEGVGCCEFFYQSSVKRALRLLQSIIAGCNKSLNSANFKAAAETGS
jgi:hypothetical protein